MPPKQQPQKNAKGAQQFIDDDYSDLPTLPPLNDFIFTTLHAFKYRKNVSQLQSSMLKPFQYPPEDPQAAKYKTISKEDIIERAKLKQYITEEEAADISKVASDKLTEVFAKVTNELILGIEVPLRRLKKDQPVDQNKELEVEVTIWLKDFPKTKAEFESYYAQKQLLQGAYIIEEQFLPEEEEDSGLKFSSPDPTLDNIVTEEEVNAKQVKMKNEYTQEDRVQAFQAVEWLNKLVNSPTSELGVKVCNIQKLKFKGPDPPALTPEEESDEYRKEDEQRFYDDFALQFKNEISQTAQDVQEYKQLKTKVTVKPLWPYPEDPLQKQREQEEREREEKRKQEEEKKQQELLAQQQALAKGKGTAAQKAAAAAAAANQKSQTQLRTGSAQSQRSQAKPVEAKKKKTSQDEEEKDWSFQHLDKILSEIKPGVANIGSILAAMVFQIDSTSKNRKEFVDKQYFLQTDEQENKLLDYFDGIFNKIAIEHNLQEASFHHQFSDQLIGHSNTSPYQSLFNERDRVSQISQSYQFLNGDTISKNESITLQSCEFPGINQRQGMPAVPTVPQAQREADLGAILQFSSLSQSQTKRLLILRACEEMMQKQQPERDFFFLDRNFMEKLDPLTFRQELALLMKQKPELCYHYYEREDALLLGLFFKTPPGRLLRRQWTYPVKVFPDFHLWKKYVKQENIPMDEQLLDIETHKVGVIRTNTKFCYPCDNSIIRVDKHQLGSRRIGQSVIIKDNLTFGVKESYDKFKGKVGGEEDLTSMEAWFASDRRCDLWLEFENGVKLLVEMQDHAEGHFEDIPLQEPLPLEEVKELALEIPKAQEPQPAELSPKQPTGRAAGKESVLSKNESQKSLKQKQAAQTQQVKSPPLQASMLKSESQKSLEEPTPVTPSKETNARLRESQARLMSPLNKPAAIQDNNDPTKGSKLTFTFVEGLIVQILPNGDVCQTIIENPQEKKKYGGTIQNSKSASQQEKQRVITKNGTVILYYLDGNMAIYYADGTLTLTDKRKGVWFTTNPNGVKRIRKLKDNQVYDEPKRLKITEKIDPETNAVIQTREDGVLVINYVSGERLVMMPDGTEIQTKKEGEQGTKYIVTKEGYAPVREIFDPVKARAKTIIGLGGTDALMGIDNIMERCNNGRIMEVLLPDKTQVQSYLERQELEGYNNFCTNMIHLIRRDDYSILKVKQDGEVVIISSNEREYLNKIGKRKEFGHDDYDYFFEMFGIPNERRSGVYTANLDQGKIWTQDEEGNIFIIYANGNSVEKLSVSFNLDQMVEGIEKKEPSSPRIQDGEYIEEECKFLPPPKQVAHPRLFMVKNDQAYEFLNQEQLEYNFRCKNKDPTIRQSNKKIRIDNEEATSHYFMKKSKGFDSHAFLPAHDLPKIPQSVELINQTISIPKEPVKEEYLWRNFLEFNQVSSQDVNDFNNAIKRHRELRQRQKDEQQRLKVVDIATEEHREMQSKIWLRIAKERGIDASQLVGEEYKPLKEIVMEEKRQKFLDDLDTFFTDDEDGAK